MRKVGKCRLIGANVAEKFRLVARIGAAKQQGYFQG